MPTTATPTTSSTDHRTEGAPTATSGRAEPVLATPISRWGWLGSNLVVIAAGVAALMALVGLATGIGVAIATGDASHVLELTLAHLNQVPAVLVVLGVAALLFGALPAAIPAIWALVGYGLIVGTFGPMLDLPQTAYNLSLFEHAAEMPLETFALAPVLILLLVAVGPAILGPLAFRQRDIDVT
jgi:ABC-2 type transport system permease protein